MTSTASSSRSRLAVDIGGTFTDLVGLSDDGRIVYTKALTTYDNLARGVFDCIRKGDVEAADAAFFIHGSTIAINTVIQQKGARTGLITTAGFRDVYEIGRSNRPDAYNLNYRRPAPLIPRDLRLEVGERIDAAGTVRQALDEDSVRAAVRALSEAGVKSIAVVLLHAYANPAHEIRIGEIVAEEFPGCFVSLSHEILREFREYERTSTTALNAYVAPTVSLYVGHLERALADARFGGQFMIMQSNGGTMSAGVAKDLPVAMMESGPVAGVIGAGKLGQMLGAGDVISFDMGGTTAKASLVIDGEARVVTGYHIGGYESGHPMMLPVVDIVEVGTGGGSIAWIDAAGGLKVGPLSAGSDPGPVCYGNGGTEPTVTDANLVLGRLNAKNFLGGEMALDVKGAEAAIRERIAEPLGLDVTAAALGIVRIADAKMSLAVREVSVTKGHDPRDFAMVASGGAGPLHAVAIARELSIPKVIIPELPGTFSAFGMLFADVRHDYVRTYIRPLANLDLAAANAGFDEMLESALATLKTEGVPAERTTVARSVDLRYRGQEYTLTVMVGGDKLDAAALAALRTRFDELHFAKYQHSAPKESVEIVNLRLSAFGALGGEAAGQVQLIGQTGGKRTGKPGGKRPVVFAGGAVDCPVYQRDDLVVGQTIAGPAVIEELVSTTIVHPGDRATLNAAGPIIIDIGN
jgi:N-methylhydantoinase A